MCPEWTFEKWVAGAEFDSSLLTAVTGLRLIAVRSSPTSMQLPTASYRATSSARAQIADFPVSKTVRSVVVDHAGGLHVGINDRGPDKTETAPLEVFRNSLRQCCFRGQLFEGLPGILQWFTVHEIPYVFVEGSEFFPDPQKSPSIVDCGIGLEGVADDSGIVEQLPDSVIAILGDVVVVELVEGVAESVPLFQDSDPAQARLHSLQDESFEQLLIDVQRHAPFLVMVFLTERMVAGPNTSGNSQFHASLAQAIQRLPNGGSK